MWLIKLELRQPILWSPHVRFGLLQLRVQQFEVLLGCVAYTSERDDNIYRFSSLRRARVYYRDVFNHSYSHIDEQFQRFVALTYKLRVSPGFRCWGHSWWKRSWPFCYMSYSMHTLHLDTEI